MHRLATTHTSQTDRRQTDDKQIDTTLYHKRDC